MHPSLTVFDEAIFGFINRDFTIETLDGKCKFTEGPVRNKEGYYLFSDITANSIYKLVVGQSKELVNGYSGTNNPNDEHLKPDQVGSNGLAYRNESSNLLVCRHGSHEVAVWNGRDFLSLIKEYKGRPFNSPNDLVADGKGRIFFSDPPYGLKDGKLNHEKFQPIAGVYCFDEGEIKLICDKYQYPNGVCITPDGKELYICSNKPVEKFITVYDIETLQFKRILAEENSDGIKCDPHGNVYLCNKDGITILNAKGKRLALIQFPTVPANCCWGRENKKDLFVTARENIFYIKDFLQ